MIVNFSQDDIVFLDKRKEGIKRNAQGHYEMSLPFKQCPYLPCRSQIQSLEQNSSVKMRNTRQTKLLI